VCKHQITYINLTANISQGTPSLAHQSSKTKEGKKERKKESGADRCCSFSSSSVLFGVVVGCGLWAFGGFGGFCESWRSMWMGDGKFVH